MEISIEHLSKSYGFQKAVDDISFTIKPGEITGFLGPNGAGKTTTMKMITGYIAPEGGAISLGGRLLHEYSDRLKRTIGYLPESNPLYPEMPVIDYLKFTANLQGMPSGKIPERVREMIGVCGIEREKHKKIQELSKGYRQRVGLAQAMIHDPEILILDEPTSGLDPNQIVEIRKLIRELGREKTVILSTHILPEVEATCDRILIINKGKIVADGTADMLRRQASGGELIRLRVEDADPDQVHRALTELSAVKVAGFTDRATGRFEIQTRADTHAAREIFTLCASRSWVITELTPMETKLEDIFRNLTMN